jgi:hypothetical protein
MGRGKKHLRKAPEKPTKTPPKSLQMTAKSLQNGNNQKKAVFRKEEAKKGNKSEKYVPLKAETKKGRQKEKIFNNQSITLFSARRKQKMAKKRINV